MILNYYCMILQLVKMGMNSRMQLYLLVTWILPIMLQRMCQE